MCPHTRALSLLSLATSSKMQRSSQPGTETSVREFVKFPYLKEKVDFAHLLCFDDDMEARSSFMPENDDDIPGGIEEHANENTGGGVAQH